MNGLSERTEARDRVARLRAIDQVRRGADALVEQRETGRRARGVAQHFEDRERPPQQRIVARRRLHHHELAGRGGGGNRRSREREDVVIRRQPRVRNDVRGDVEGHSRQYTLWSLVGSPVEVRRALPENAQ